ncbi:MAG: GIY-YIG nuclease family protein [Lachnospiraceae bacterium]|nr:GIY-YIG nuclease family protein [Lachnospiraceae bacterium]
MCHPERRREAPESKDPAPARRTERRSKHRSLSYKSYYVYILTNWNCQVMYVGVTNDLKRRLFEHKNKMLPGFTATNNVNKLVYYEEAREIDAAIAREKQIKGWSRDKKNDLVRSMNPEWKDLSKGWN